MRGHPIAEDVREELVQVLENGMPETGMAHDIIALIESAGFMITRRRIETWGGIAKAAGRSERWCRYMAKRGLPVFKVGWIVCAHQSALTAWLLGAKTRGG